MQTDIFGDNPYIEEKKSLTFNNYFHFPDLILNFYSF